jgi:hypothetical protein
MLESVIKCCKPTDVQMLDKRGNSKGHGRRIDLIKSCHRNGGLERKV